MINKPEINLTLQKADRTLGLAAHKVLLVGRYTSNIYIKNALIDNLDNGHLKNMVKFYKKIAPRSSIYILGVNGSATKVQAKATINVPIGVEAATVLTINILDEMLVVNLAAQMSQEDVIEAINTALLTSQYIVGVEVADGILTLTTSLIGTLGNNIYFDLQGSDTITITGFTGGSGTDLVNFAAIGDDRYQTICLSSEFEPTPMSQLLKSRENVPNQVLEGVGFYTIQNGNPNSSDFEDNFNNMWISKLGVKLSNQHRDMVTVALGALRYIRFTENEDTSLFVDNSAGLDNKRGGIGMASIPYHNTNLTKYISVIEDFTINETSILESKRVGVIGKDTSGFNILLGSMFTTEVVDNLGNPDTTYRFLNNVDVSMVLKEYFYNNLKKDFAQSTMVRANAIPERGQKTTVDVKAKLNLYYLALVEFGIVERFDDFKKQAIVEFDFINGIIKINYIFYPVQAIRGISGTSSIKIGD